MHLAIIAPCPWIYGPLNHSYQPSTYSLSYQPKTYWQHSLQRFLPLSQPQLFSWRHWTQPPIRRPISLLQPILWAAADILHRCPPLSQSYSHLSLPLSLFLSPHGHGFFTNQNPFVDAEPKLQNPYINLLRSPFRKPFSKFEYLFVVVNFNLFRDPDYSF